MNTEEYTLLYVDDESRNLRAFKSLYRRDYNVLTAESGQEGLDVLAKNDVQLIITDQRMPEMSGIDFLKEVKVKWPEPKCILLTGYIDNESLKEAVNDVGIYFYVNKPFDRDQMALLINRGLGAYLTEKEKRLTDQKLKENALIIRESERLAHLGIWQWTLSSGDVTWSDELYRIYGLAMNDSESSIENYLKLLHADDRDRVEAIINECVNTKQPARYEERIIRPDGSERNIKSWVAMLNAEGDKPPKIFGTCLDITDMKNKERALRASEAELRSLTENAPSYILKIDRDYKIKYINRHHEGSDPVGTSLFSIIPKSDHDKVEKILKNVFQTSQPGYFETGGVRPDGQVWYSTNVGSISENGHVDHLLLVTSDITEKKRAEQRIQEINDELEDKVETRTKELRMANAELKRAEKEVKQALSKEKELGELKSRFVATASHQFRTPLTVIQSNVELLEMNLDRMDDNLKSRFKKSFVRITKESSRMTELMNEVLILGKINAGGMISSPIMLDISLMAQEIADRLNEVTTVQSKIRMEVINEPRELFLDEKQLSHVLLNVLGNAQKYSLDRGDVDLKLKYGEDAVEITVADHGIGVSKDDLDNLFEPFFRGGNTEGIEGTGLGLTVVYEYIKLNNGRVTVASKLGKGTTFTITFYYNQNDENI